MQPIHQFNHGECLPAVHQLILQHTHQTVVGQQIPKDIRLRILQHLCWRVFHYPQRSVTQQVRISSHFRIEQPLRISQHLVEQELHGSLLFFLLHERIGLLPITYRSIFQINSADIGKHMVKVIVPLVDYRIIQAGSLFISLPFLSGGSPLNDLRHNTLQVLDAQQRRADGVISQVFNLRTGVNRIPDILRFTIFAQPVRMTIQETGKQFLFRFRGFLAIPAIAILYGKHVVRSYMRRESRHPVSRLCHVIEACIIHDGRRGAVHTVRKSL